MRLEKYLSEAGIASRRKSKELILKGLVKVNGAVILAPGHHLDKDDIVVYQGKKVTKANYLYFLMNKPRGVISSLNDEKGRKTIIDLMYEEDRKEYVFPVGRLDYDTSGLILLTNDGELTYILTRPEYNVPKTYLASLDGLIKKEELKVLAQGIALKGYQSRPSYAKIKEKDFKKKTSLVEITLREGKNHQVKEIFLELGYRVTSLVRIKFADLTLKGVSKGSYRPLTIHEVKTLYRYKYHKIKQQ
ncbi:MAG: pseudouridine synthase [Acholeplasmatales bacterium]|jgi:23S rRNA pseudouridine2605 synthase|nr:rRNA pseudouridine synthase [Acholeplasmataceae bacterium]MDY0115202.1 pseudouridine synthase [Acholeplasmatales bacterium]MCK9233675.1 rRNA pseudouridine synthase [Acholeplasmataceae bacterium]MCK9288936.1 rRNA pseudouridine synthase [Acholeplasmataceae bacterium]MCK9427530.1 rRNA pseudouridine synthase [Acholeplasmataceae bacterium]